MHNLRRSPLQETKGSKFSPSFVNSVSMAGEAVADVGFLTISGSHMAAAVPASKGTKGAIRAAGNTWEGSLRPQPPALIGRAA